jgi:pimeloyl-ACP methyl ester carboxylesterase
VLVGRSYGGLVVRLYAMTYPQDVSGLVLIDALSEELQTRLTPDQQALCKPLLDPVTREDIAGYKDIERLDSEGSFEEVRAAAAPATPGSAVRRPALGATGSVPHRFGSVATRHSAGLRVRH